jgi:hypothetical protein
MQHHRPRNTSRGQLAVAFLCALCISAVNFCAAWLKRVPSRLIELKQDLEPNYIRSKPYLEFPNSKRKSLRQRAARRRGRVFRQSPRKIAVWASDGNVADIVRRNGKPGFAFVALKRDRSNFF